MIIGYYKIAGAAIEIRSIYEGIHKMSSNYKITNQKPDIIIETTPEDIEYDREIAAKTAEIEGNPVVNYSASYIETISVHRKLAEEMIHRNVLLFHGSAIAVDGQVYIFTAKSGTGKSTHARLWRQKFGDRAIMVNDDKPMLRVHESGVNVCGTPWNGKHSLDTNVELPLKALCIIHQNKDNHIERISARDAIPALWQQSYRPTDDVDMGKMLQLFGDIAEQIPIYEMGCNMEPEAADVAWKGMNSL